MAFQYKKEDAEKRLPEVVRKGFEYQLNENSPRQRLNKDMSRTGFIELCELECVIETSKAYNTI